LGGVFLFSLAISLVVLVNRGGREDAIKSADASGPPPSEEAKLEKHPLSSPKEALVLSTSIQGRLQRGETLSTALRKQGVPFAQIQSIVKALQTFYNFRRARPGARYSVRQDPQGRLQSFRFEHSALEIYEVQRQGELFKGRRLEFSLQTREVLIDAPIQSSLYQALKDQGESPSLVAQLVEIFAWDLDFFKDTHPGDHLRLLLEKLYKDKSFVRYGRILMGEYRGRSETFQSFFFQAPGEEGGYYLENGESARKTFLATPLRFSRISSGFGKRRHPILGYTRKHQGVDYAAPRGTPVWAMASGKIKFAGRKGPNGNLVVIDHGQRLLSYYAHLHSIHKGIKRGVKVKQKQLIGTVGSTGRSTGPHLHFGLKQKGHYINPRDLKVRRGAPLPERHRSAFRALVAKRKEALAATEEPQEAQAEDGGLRVESGVKP